MPISSSVQSSRAAFKAEKRAEAIAAIAIHVIVMLLMTWLATVGLQMFMPFWPALGIALGGWFASAAVTLWLFLKD